MTAPIRVPAWRATTVDAADEVIEESVLRAMYAAVHRQIARVLDHEFMAMEDEVGPLRGSVEAGFDAATEIFL